MLVGDRSSHLPRTEGFPSMRKFQCLGQFWASLMLAHIVALCELAFRCFCLWVDPDIPVNVSTSRTRPSSKWLPLARSPGQSLHNWTLLARCQDEVKWGKCSKSNKTVCFVKYWDIKKLKLYYAFCKHWKNKAWKSRAWQKKCIAKEGRGFLEIGDCVQIGRGKLKEVVERASS